MNERKEGRTYKTREKYRQYGERKDEETKEINKKTEEEGKERKN